MVVCCPLQKLTKGLISFEHEHLDHPPHLKRRRRIKRRRKGGVKKVNYPG
jgi:hypothetical protein